MNVFSLSSLLNGDMNEKKKDERMHTIYEPYRGKLF